MVDVFVKGGDRRPLDPRMRAMLGNNRQTLTRMADHLTNGAFSAAKAPPAEPKPEGLIIHAAGQAAAAREPRREIRVALNGRVLMIDADTGRQLHLLGAVRGGRFALATRENGFMARLDEAVAAPLRDLDASAFESEDALATRIASSLGLG